MKRSDVVIERSGTATWLEVKTNVKLLDKEIEMFKFPSKESYWDLVSEHGPAVAALISKLRKERGVKNVFLNPYEVSIHLVGANKITDSIQKAFEDFIYQSAKLEDMDEEGFSLSISYSPANPDKMVVDFNFEISSKAVTLKRKPAEKLFKGMNSALKKLLKAIVSIDGVTEISAKDYQMVVGIAPLFDPEAIAKKITDALMEFIKL